jgi:hypothetical protein
MRVRTRHGAELSARCQKRSCTFNTGRPATPARKYARNFDTIADWAAKLGQWGAVSRVTVDRERMRS